MTRYELKRANYPMQRPEGGPVRDAEGKVVYGNPSKCETCGRTGRTYNVGKFIGWAWLILNGDGIANGTGKRWPHECKRCANKRLKQVRLDYAMRNS